jgi:wyosine [tRNA(Phe)-imidazoG37] synthetase (radical SAM superfamily)
MDNKPATPILQVLFFIYNLMFPAVILFGLVLCRLCHQGRLFVGLLVWRRTCAARSAEIMKKLSNGPADPLVVFTGKTVGFFRTALKRVARLTRADSQQLGREDNFFCPVPFEKLVVNCDGTVQCGSAMDSPLLGDVRRKTIAEIWNGPAIRDIRSAILNGSAARCGKCAIHSLKINHFIKQNARVFMPEGPSIVWIEPTCVCNIDCPQRCGCGTPKILSQKSRRSKLKMSLDEFKSVIGMLGKDTRTVGFVNYGEQFLHPDFITMIKHARFMLPDTLIFSDSNGTLLNDDTLLQGLAESGLDELRLSVDGCDQKSYEVYRRGGNFDDIMEAVRKLSSIRKRKPKILWQYILFFWNDSRKQIAQALSLAKDIHVDKFAFQLSSIPLSNSSRFAEGTRGYKSIMPFILDTRRFNYKYTISASVNLDGNLLLRITNKGDVRWNSEQSPWGRFVQLAVYVHSPDRGRRLIFSKPLFRDVDPNDTIIFYLPLDSLLPEGIFLDVFFDLFIENEFFFGERGNTPLVFDMTDIIIRRRVTTTARPENCNFVSV